VRILPYIEQQNLYNQLLSLDPVHQNGIASAGYQAIRKVPVYRCPSDPYKGDDPTLFSYSGNGGPYCIGDAGCGAGTYPFDAYCDQPGWGYTATPTGVWGPPPYQLSDVPGMFARATTGGSDYEGMVKVRIADVVDGLSNTFLYGENLPGQTEEVTTIPYSGGWGSDNSPMILATTTIPLNYKIDESDTKWCASGTVSWLPGAQPGPSADPLHNLNNAAVSHGFKSKHPGGANFAFVDGSVHFVPASISTKSYNQLGHRFDGQVPDVP